MVLQLFQNIRNKPVPTMVLILLYHVQGHLGYVETQQFSASFSAGISASFSVSFSVLGYFLWEQPASLSAVGLLFLWLHARDITGI
jgi:hypothetical protein